MQKAVIGASLAVATMLFMASALALLQGSKSISNSGTIKAINVGVYSDSGCTQALSSLTWGMMDPNSSSVKVMYVKNEGNTAMTLNMTTNTWSPSNAANYITVTWNREDAVVNPGSSVQANVTLSVSPSITGITSFTFTMVIAGTG
jgi:hypothetical protein